MARQTVARRARCQCSALTELHPFVEWLKLQFFGWSRFRSRIKSEEEKSAIPAFAATGFS